MPRREAPSDCAGERYAASYERVTKSWRRAMGNKLLAWALAAFALFGGIESVRAEEFGTSAQAKAMIQQAIDALKANEGDAIKAFNDKNNNQFHVLDL